LESRQVRRLRERKPWKLEPRKTKFAGELLTCNIPKYIKDKDGNEITTVNKRTMMRKALRAFIDNKPYYTYKKDKFIVPRLSINNEEEE